ncbi:unnamed protein product [Spirodela intermedia]|uniref:HMA domain-containing protein n=1 Tax=Spirodela intermedia TaxID=51605 RepID=A0A7I8INE6_SPIIN|nr:unnamed protein product [Spirodela intermedia]CAA6659475.1 unnamed protein product [Spirodela intermedia]
MCQPNASTAVCIPGDAHSVVVPRRPDRTLVDHARIVDLRYSRLVDHPRLAGPAAAAAVALAKGEKLHQLAAPTAAKSVPPPKAEKLLKMIVPMSDAGERRLEMVALPTTAVVVAPPKRERKTAVPSLPSSNDQVFQVVVMRVSLHCQGCAGKVKKHISKMEGVTSFSVDLESKRVTVMGHVSLRASWRASPR